MRVDIYISSGSGWNLYVESVTKTNAERMARTLERQGELVKLVNAR